MQLAISNKNDDFIGCIGVHNFSYNDTYGYLDIGYWINTEHTKKGYMLEALIGLIKYLNQNIQYKKIFITTDVDNLSSNRLAEKAGFTLLETKTNDLKKPNGKYRDTNIYFLDRTY